MSASPHSLAAAIRGSTRTELVVIGSGRIAFGESPKRQPNLTIVEFHYESPEERLAAGK